MKQFPEVLSENDDASVSFVSKALFLEQMFGYSIQAEITGSPLGFLKLEGSVDAGIHNIQSVAFNGIVDWNTIAGSSQAVTGSGRVTWNVQTPNYRWVRVSYSATSGSGNIRIVSNSKGF